MSITLFHVGNLFNGFDIHGERVVGTISHKMSTQHSTYLQVKDGLGNHHLCRVSDFNVDSPVTLPANEFSWCQ